MPARRKTRRSSNALSGPGAIALLIILLLFFAYETWQENRERSQTPAPRPPAAQTQRAQATSAPGAQPTQASGQPAPVGDAITVWFSDPLSGQTTNGPETPLVDAIRGAQRTVDVAIYNISLQNLSEALYNAHRRGVRVRMVMESEAMERDVPQSLMEAGVPIIGDQREGLMHNKFVIIDGQEVWMGSLNFTSTGAYKDFNNLVRFRSPEMVQNYQVNFDEMFTEQKFGNDKEPNTSHPRVMVDGVEVEVYFSPDDGVAAQVVAELRQARQSIDFLAYSFTANDIAEAMQQRAASGVRVRGVFDESQVSSNTGGEYDPLLAAGFDVHLDGIPGLLHDKVIIIDGQTVITGSYNFSANAENTNDENLVIIHNAAIAARYLEHFQQVYENAQN